MHFKAVQNIVKILQKYIFELVVVILGLSEKCLLTIQVPMYYLSCERLEYYILYYIKPHAITAAVYVQIHKNVLRSRH